jgi:hypothetical protein
MHTVLKCESSKQAKNREIKEQSKTRNTALRTLHTTPLNKYRHFEVPVDLHNLKYSLDKPKHGSLEQITCFYNVQNSPIP